jgi:two-component system sensor histidine kinase KdpD
MTQPKTSFFSLNLEKFLWAILTVAATTGIMFLIGRDRLGEGVIALLYLIPISWSTTRWGQGPGIAAAIAAALGFNFFFIPPFYTFNISSLEGWLLLGIFLAVAIVVVGRIQSGLSRAQASEREAIFMYELSTALASATTPQAVARTLAETTQLLYQAARVQVFVERNGQPYLSSSPEQSNAKGKPDLILPIESFSGLLGEMRLWQGEVRLPKASDRLLQNFAKQGGLALERARLAQYQIHPQTA